MDIGLTTLLLLMGVLVAMLVSLIVQEIRVRRNPYSHNPWAAADTPTDWLDSEMVHNVSSALDSSTARISKGIGRAAWGWRRAGQLARVRNIVTSLEAGQEATLLPPPPPPDELIW
jgi:hypothetical protein